MSFRNRRALRLRPVNSIKKVVEASGALVAATTSTIDLVATVDGTAWVDAADASVPQGCTVSSIYLSVYGIVNGDGTAAPIFQWYVGKNPNNQLTMPAPNAAGGNSNRRWIVHSERGLTGNSSGTPMMFKGVIKLPPRMRRMGRDDHIFLKIISLNFAGAFCIQAIYKFFQ